VRIRQQLNLKRGPATRNHPGSPRVARRLPRSRDARRRSPDARWGLRSGQVSVFLAGLPKMSTCGFYTVRLFHVKKSMLSLSSHSPEAFVGAFRILFHAMKLTPFPNQTTHVRRSGSLRSTVLVGKCISPLGRGKWINTYKPYYKTPTNSPSQASPKMYRGPLQCQQPRP